MTEKQQDWADEMAAEYTLANTPNRTLVANLFRQASTRSQWKIDKLVEALERMVKMHDLMMAKVNHKQSFYNAKCLQEMNEAPIQAIRALASVKQDTLTTSNSQWRPINEIPDIVKAGKRVLVWHKNYSDPICAALYGSEWRQHGDLAPLKYQPTHFMPLPTSPDTGAE